MLKRSILCILLLFGTAANGVAEEIVLTRVEKLYRVKDPLIFRDKTGSISVDRIISDSVKFSHSGNSMAALGVIDDAVWINIKLKNNTSDDDWYIQLLPPILKEVDFYSQQPDGRFNHISLNDQTRYGNRPVKINGLILPLGLKQGASGQFYLRVKSDYTLKVPLYIGTLKTIYEQNHQINMVNGVMFGLLLALMVYNLFIYMAIKDITYLYYFGYTLFTILFQLIWNAYCASFLSNWKLDILPLSSSFALIFSILFTNSFLRVDFYRPAIYRLQNWLLALFLVPVCIEFVGSHSTAFRYFQMIMYVAFMYWALVGWLVLRQGFKPANYYLVAFGCLLMSSTFYNLKDNGWVSDGFHSALGFHLGTGVQALILSFALAAKLNYLKKETAYLQKATLAQTERFSKELIAGQENERANITNELEVRIGQQLVLLKNELFLLKKQNEYAHFELFNAITEDIGKTIEEISQVSYSLRPYQMGVLGLKLSVERLVKEITFDTNIVTDLQIDNIDHLMDKQAEMNLYRIIQELMNNLIKHAEAFNCKLIIKKTKKNIKLYYHDDGKGYNTLGKAAGLGLAGIKERCNLLNASIAVSSAIGTKVYLKIPVPLTTDSVVINLANNNCTHRG